MIGTNRTTGGSQFIATKTRHGRVALVTIETRATERIQDSCLNK